MSPDVITDVFELSGIFRNAFLRKSQVKLLDEAGTLHTGYVSSFYESNARSKNYDQYLLISGCNPTKVQGVELFLENKKYSFTTHCEYQENGVKVSLPKQMFQLSQRKKKRISIGRTTHCYVISNAGARKIVSDVELLNLSEAGCGFLVPIENFRERDIGSTLQIVAYNTKGSFNKTAIIKSISTTEDGRNNRVGIEFQEHKKKPASTSVRPLRSEYKLVLTLHHPVLKNLKFNAVTKNCSVEGALVEVLDTQVFSYVFTEIELFSVDPAITFKVVSINKERKELSLKMTSGDLEDKIQWAKYVYYGDKASGTEFYNQHEVLDLISSGAGLTKNTIEENRSVLLSQSKEEVFSDGKSDCALKIVRLNGNGEVGAYINAIRTAYNSWHVGGIVSKLGNQEHTKDFINSFFTLLNDLNTSAKEFSTFSISWKVNHPFWIKFADFLKSANSDTFWFGTVLRYSFSKIESPTLDGAISIEETHLTQVKPKNEYLELVKSLGFTEEGLECRWVSGGAKIDVKKKIFSVFRTGKTIGHLFVVSQSYALGVHRNTEACWYIPEEKTNSPLFLSESMAISLALAKIGIRPPSMLAIGDKQPEDSASKVALMNYYVYGPKALKWYIENI